MQYQEKYEWDVDDYLPLDQFESKFAEASAMVDSLDDWWEKLSSDMDASVFKEMFGFFEKKETLLIQVYYSVYLRHVVDVKNQQYLEMKTRVEDLYVTNSKRSIRINHWFRQLPVEGKKQLDKENAERLYASIPEASYFFDVLIEKNKHSFSEAEEKINSSKSPLIESLESTANLIRTEMIFHVAMPDGSTKIVETPAELQELGQTKDRRIRRAVSEASSKETAKHADKLFVIYQALVKDNLFNVIERKFDSGLDKRASSDELDEKTIEILLDVCEKNAIIYATFFDALQKLLGVDTLMSYDMYAPVGEKQKNMAFSDAVSLVLDCFSQVDKDFTDKAKRIVERQHIDTHPNKNKKSGGFCTTSPYDCSYILLNYNGTSDSVSVLAHELGHGVHHQYFAHQFFLLRDASTGLSETVSTFAEAIVTDALIKQAPSVEVKKELLATRIRDSFGTIISQLQRTRFEQKSHELIAKGTSLDALSDYWRDLSNKLTSNKFTHEFPESKHVWTRIMHLFDIPFYCYSYAFGYLLSLSLYKSYKKDPSYFEKIKYIMEAGGSKKPEDILSDVGIDIRSEAFWQQGFDVIKEWVDEFAALVDK